MKFSLEIECDNAAFGEEDPDIRLELTGCLKDAARDVLRGYTEEGLIRDSNGNLVGKWRLTA